MKAQIGMQNQWIVTPFFLDRHSVALEPLAQPGWTLNRPELPASGSPQQRISAYQRPLADFVARAAARGDRPVSIAGDCCTAIACLAGLRRAGLDPLLIWLDAHGDFNTWETSPSGFLGGMPLAMLVGRGEQTLLQAVSLPPLAETQVVLCDARDLDPAEKQALDASQVTHLGEIDALLDLPRQARSIHLHFDTDILNPQDAPAMSYATPGGPSATHLSDVFRRLAAAQHIASVSVSTWNPALDVDGHTREVCMDVLHSLVES